MSVICCKSCMDCRWISGVGKTREKLKEEGQKRRKLGKRRKRRKKQSRKKKGRRKES